MDNDDTKRSQHEKSSEKKDIVVSVSRDDIDKTWFTIDPHDKTVFILDDGIFDSSF